MSRKEKKKKGLAAVFQHWTPDALACQVLAGFSLNVEVMIEAPTIPSEFLIGKGKVTVAEITVPLGMEGMYWALPPGVSKSKEKTDKEVDSSGRKFWAKQMFKSYAGSSANFEGVLRHLQQELPPSRVKRVAIIATIGMGGQSLINELTEKGVQYGLMKADGTNITLNVRPRSGRQVMICEKNPYQPPSGLVDLLRRADPQVAVFTGVRSQDLPTVRDIFRAYQNRRTVRVFSPHIDVLADPAAQADLREAIRGSILQVNEEEALELTKGNSLFGDDNPFDRTDDEHANQLAHAVAAFGAQITIVTLSDYGVVVIAGGQIIRHYGVAPPRGVRDISGAGDAFLGALIYYYVLTNRLNNRHVDLRALERAVNRAVIVAAHKVSHVGSSRGIPTAAEVERIIAKGNKKKR